MSQDRSLSGWFFQDATGKSRGPLPTEMISFNIKNGINSETKFSHPEKYPNLTKLKNIQHYFQFLKSEVDRTIIFSQKKFASFCRDLKSEKNGKSEKVG